MKNSMKRSWYPALVFLVLGVLGCAFAGDMSANGTDAGQAQTAFEGIRHRNRTITPGEFEEKWGRSTLSERSGYAQHFIDLCELADHAPPAELDAEGRFFTFEKGVMKRDGGGGFADVWYDGKFAIEYKGPGGRDLEAAYEQLLQYREALNNPPLLVTCDFKLLIIRTNFTGSPTATYLLYLGDLTRDEIASNSRMLRQNAWLDKPNVEICRLASPRGMEILTNMFYNPERLRPGATNASITEEAAKRLKAVARNLSNRGHEPDKVAAFQAMFTFAMYAEDTGHLQDQLFTKVLERSARTPDKLVPLLGELFAAMSEGGDFGVHDIARFNGDLFSDPFALELGADDIGSLLEVAKYDWTQIDPSIIGSTFTRGLDTEERAALGAEYTDPKDSNLLTEAVMMRPWRRQWDARKAEIQALLDKNAAVRPDGKPQYSESTRRKNLSDAKRLASDFLDWLSSRRILDSSAGCGDMLYIGLVKMLDFEKEIILWLEGNGLGKHYPRVHPRQLYAIEINRYAHTLSKMTVWIGYLQWLHLNGYGKPKPPVLESLEGNFLLADALFDFSDPGNAKRRDLGEFDVVLTNPPYSGSHLIAQRLGQDYRLALDTHYPDVPGRSDYACYFVDLLLEHVRTGKIGRVGMIVTGNIRKGISNQALKNIKAHGDIFFGISDMNWDPEGAKVRVCMIGFDDGAESERFLDGKPVPYINADLTSRLANLVHAKQLKENERIAYSGGVKSVKFEIDDAIARDWLHAVNASGKPNADVLYPFLNGADITGVSRQKWVIDFYGMDFDTAEQYEKPFAHLRNLLEQDNPTGKWWLHSRPAAELRRLQASADGKLLTPRSSTNRVFIQSDLVTYPDSALSVFLRHDDYFFAVLESRPHEVWSIEKGSQLGTSPRYTPTTCFLTFPLPWPPGQEERDSPQYKAIHRAGRELREKREAWLYPDSLYKVEILTFPASVDSRWKPLLSDVNADGVGVVKYSRMVPRDNDAAREARQLTLGNLYTQNPPWLRRAKAKLSAAVMDAYRHATGDERWQYGVADDELLDLLLNLQKERAESNGVSNYMGHMWN